MPSPEAPPARALASIRRGGFAALAFCAAALVFPHTVLGDVPSLARIDYPAGVTPPGPDPVYRERDVGATRVTVEWGGRERSFHLHAGGGDGRRPVVVLLHEAGRTGRSMIDMWKATADREGLVLVAPDSLGENWDLAADGPEFLQAVLNEAASRTPMDAARLHLFGHAAGGNLALLYVNRIPEAWRAASVHAGGLPGRAVALAPEGPPILMFVGEEDGVSPTAYVMASARALAQAGHPVEVVEIREHGRWLYAIGPWLSRRAWEFFATR